MGQVKHGEDPQVKEIGVANAQRASTWDSMNAPSSTSPERSRTQIIFNYTNAVLRSYGLSLLAHVVPIMNLKSHEMPKTAFHRDRLLAILRATIHVVPCTIAMAEIIVNCRGYYIGANVDGLSYFQFAAKLHEMAMQSSLAIIVLGYVRYVLFIGEPLTIGALLSGLQLTQVGFMWSMELWGIAVSNIRLKRKVCTLILIIVAVFLASTAGPSSAILLIPNLNYWPAGSTHVWINAAFKDLWPSRLDGSSLPVHCVQAPIISNICPSSEWHSISDYLTLANGIIPAKFLGPYTVSPFSVQVTGQGSQRQLIIQHHIYANHSAAYDQAAAQATTQHSAVADVLTATSSLWDIALQNSDSPFFDQRDSIQSIVSDNYQPYTLASCGTDVILGETDDRPVAFPVPPGSSPDMLEQSDINHEILQMDSIELFGLSRLEILNTPGSNLDYRTKWVDLPEKPFNGSSIGVVILQPTTNSTQGVLLCNLAAGWGTTSINMSSSPAASGTGLATSSIYDPTSHIPQAKDYSQRIADSIVSFQLPLFPQKPINISASWGRYLDADIPNLNTTVINALMGNKLAYQDDATSANIILAGLLANGLSRTGFDSQLQGNLRTVFNRKLNASIPDGHFWFAGRGDMFTVDPERSRDWVRLRVDSSVEGYAFSTQGFAPKLAVAVLLLYCFLVIMHIIYAALSGVSSTSWDSIAELMALAINSSPTTKLRNTCAGITQMSAFSVPIRILSCKDPDSCNDHLELVLGDVDPSIAQDCRIRENHAYGTSVEIEGQRQATRTRPNYHHNVSFEST